MSNLATITNNILADSGIDDINVVVTNGSYANPSWITSLAWTKITGAPANIVTGTGTTNFIPKFTSSSAIGNSAISDDGSTVNIASRTFQVSIGKSLLYNVAIGGTATGIYAPYADSVVGIGNLHLGTTAGAIYINSAIALPTYINPVGGSVGINTTSPGVFTLNVNGTIRGISTFSTYVNDGLFSADARPTTIEMPNGSLMVLGYYSAGNGIYYGRIGWSTSTEKVSFGAAATNTFRVGVGTGDTQMFTVDPIGITSYGRVTVIGSNTPTVPIVDIAVSGTGAWQRGVRMLNGGMAVGDTLMYAVGRTDDTKNMGQLYFYYAAANSNSNRLSMGLSGVDDKFSIFGSGNVSINTASDLGVALGVSGSIKAVSGYVASTDGSVNNEISHSGGVSGLLGTTTNHQLLIRTNATTAITVNTNQTVVFASSISTVGGSSSAQFTFGTGGIGMSRTTTNNGIWFNAGADQNHVLWNDYYGGPTTRTASPSGFDGIKWNVYRGIYIQGGTAGAFNTIVVTNTGVEDSNTHTVSLYASNVLRLQTTTTGVSVTGDLVASGIVRSNATNGLALGSVAGYRRLQYDSANSRFGFLTDANSLANIEANQIVITDLRVGTDGVFGTSRTGNDAGATVVNLLGSSSSSTSSQLNLTQVWNGVQYPIVLRNIYNPTGGSASSLFTLSTTQWNGSAAITTERLRVDGDSGISTFSGRLVVSDGIKINSVESTLYTQNGAIAYYSSTNGVYVNGAGPSGWLRLNAAGSENDRNSINIYGSTAGAPDRITFNTAGVGRLTITNNQASFFGNVSAGTTINWYSGIGALSYGTGFITMETNSANAIQFKTNGSTAQTINTNQTIAFGSDIGLNNGQGIYFNTLGDANWRIYRSTAPNFTRSIIPAAQASLNISIATSVNEGFAIGGNGGSSYYEIKVNSASSSNHYFRGAADVSGSLSSASLSTGTINGGTTSVSTLSFTCGFSSYTTDGLFSAQAVYSSLGTPGASSRVRFGYNDYGGGQYYGAIGFDGPTQFSIGHRYTSAGTVFGIGTGYRGNGVLVDNANMVFIPEKLSIGGWGSNVAGLNLRGYGVADGTTNYGFILDRGTKIAWTDGGNSSTGEYIYSQQGSPYSVTIHSGGYNALACPNTGHVYINYEYGTCSIGSTSFSTSYKLYVTGSTYSSGGFFEASDLRLKEVVNTHEGFNFNTIEFKWNDGRDNKSHWGYAAQDVLEWLPNAVIYQEDEYLSLDYNQVHTYKIAMLEKRIAELEKQLKNK